MNAIDVDPDPDFQIEEELLEPRPRRVAATLGALLAWRWAWNLLLAIVRIIYSLGSSEMSDLKNLMAHGHIIEGYVVSAKSTRASNGTGCEVAYTLNRNATEPDGTFDLPEYSGSLPQAGDPFEVTYLPRALFVHRIGRVNSQSLAESQSHWIAVGLWWVIPYLLVMWFVKWGFAKAVSEV